MKLSGKKRIAAYAESGAPICGFIQYIDGEKPILMRRMGRQIASDVHDAYTDEVSLDNGRTWDTSRLSLKHIETAGGYIVFTENVTHYDARRDLLIHITDQHFQPGLDGPELSQSTQLRITVDHPQAFLEGVAAPPLVTVFDKDQGLAVSFTHVFEDSQGRLLFSVQWQSKDPDGSLAARGCPHREDRDDVIYDIWESAVLIGTWNDDNSLSWEVGNAVPMDIERTSRGLNEGTLAELSDGRLAMVLRGSNASWTQRPGYKWLSFSDDGGLNWSPAEPLGCDDGSVLQSSATGSWLFRSFTNGKLFWVGNLCARGEKVEGNFPRSPIVIAEVQEEPFALMRDTITVIGDREGDEDEFVQHSNFRAYQDRVTGEAVIYLTRFGEYGSQDDDWLRADCYEYRVSLD
jgi:hypothetical protein